jgi:RimJ/RimL family protein N-acetyltransferase
MTAFALRQDEIPDMALTALAGLPSGATSPLTRLSLHDSAVVIGPILPEDTATLFLWLNDVESANQDLPYRPLDWMGYNNWMAELSRNCAQSVFAIRRVDGPAIIGFVALTGIQPIHRSAELGVRIGSEKDRGKGYGSAAVALALKYAWNYLNLNRVHLRVISTNQRARAAYAKAGFSDEGVHRQALYLNGAWCDMAQMAALRPARDAQSR